MTGRLTQQQLEHAGEGYDPVAARSASIGADCYTDPGYLEVEREQIFRRSWQYLCHEEALREPGSYVTASFQDRSIVAVRGKDGVLRAFYNVCKHRGHELLKGAGTTGLITCPYHAWVYDLDGRLHRARRSELIENFDPGRIYLTPVPVEVFCHLVFVNLDPGARPLAEQTNGLAREVTGYAPDLGALTFAHRLTYTVHANWKAVMDNFLECYHCPVAHRDFVSLVEMDTYKVVTHGIWSSHMARAGRRQNRAYGVADASVTDHAVWYLWPNTTLMRYPGRGNFMVWRFIPVGPEETYEEFDTSKHALPLMRRAGGGSIINFGSYDGFIADPNLTAYCATKGAVHALTRAMACDHGPENIRVNAICPGYVDTPMLQSFFDSMGDPDGLREEARRVHPMRRYGTPEDMANLANWLAGDEARYASGQLWVLDGGLSAQVQQMRIRGARPGQGRHR